MEHNHYVQRCTDEARIATVRSHFKGYLNEQIVVVEYIWCPGPAGSSMIWSAGALVSHGICPSQVVSAYDRSTQLLHLIPKLNRKDSGCVLWTSAGRLPGLSNQ
eukprot:4210380-Karenia_brevis.AAC.1